jgi:hypothetical protein
VKDKMYQYINGTEAGNNLMYIFIYANQVTEGFAVPMFVVSFFLVVLISSVLMQIRFTSRMRFEVSLLAASFSTLGLCVLLEQQTGLLNPVYFFISIALFIASLLWVSIGSTE